MFNDPTPEDWVEQRAKCSAADMYERLRDVVRHDVEAADKHVPGNSDFNFKAEGEFVASRADPGPPEEWPVFVRFALTGGGTRISAIDSKTKPIAVARPVLAADGSCCLLEVEGGGRLSPRGFSRLALAPLFFPESEAKS